MMFAPILLFSSYLNLSNYKTDAAGITAAWSGLYGLLALRRSQVILTLSDSQLTLTTSRNSETSSPSEAQSEAPRWRSVLSM